MNAEAVFVYGTLRRGGSNHFRMANAVPVGAGSVSGKMYRIDWYPALVCGGEDSVIGEVYLVSAEHLCALDAFEGITPDADEPREYRRAKVMVVMEPGESMDAWVWEWIGPVCDAELLDDGDWLAYEPNPT